MRFPLVAALAVALLLVALPAGAPADPAPQATAAKKCSLTSKQQRGGLGATYVLTLRVSGTRCSYGRKVVKGFHACRKRNGGRDGRCRSRVFGYKCEERRFNKIASQYDSRARCKKSGREVFHIYTQNT
jgi:hypothetical protein